MDDLISGIASEVVLGLKAGVKHVGSTAVGEVKKMAKSSVSQVSAGTIGTSSSQNQSSVPGEQNVSAARWSPKTEVKSFGKNMASQITGGGQLSGEQIAKKAAEDDEFSQAEINAVQAKINRIYEEYAQKRQQEVMVKKQQEVQVEEQQEQKQELAKTQQDQPINSAIAKTKTEIGKNYGAE